MNKFIDRHNGPRKEDIVEMLDTVGSKSLDEFIGQVIPHDIRLSDAPLSKLALSESEYLAKIKAIAGKNKPLRSFIGAGFYRTATPAVVMRNVFENPSWYTSYTPYQAEISQGRLEALINFQTMIVDLTGMEISNCSLLDESTAAAEAMRMMFDLRSKSAVKEGRNTFFIDDNVFPQTKEVVATRAEPLGIRIVTGRYEDFTFDSKVFGALVQYPAADGEIRDYREFCTSAHSNDTLVAVAADLLSLALLVPPGEWGADIAVGSAQRFGIPMGFGGPSAGYMATRDSFKRNMPGRIIGTSIDKHGNPALRMALQTREQHIKREKATSNICTAQALLATMAGMYAVYHGAEGIADIALNAHLHAAMLADVLKQIGYDVTCGNFFDTVNVKTEFQDVIRSRAEEMSVNLFYPDDNHVRISTDELTTQKDIRDILIAFGVETELVTFETITFDERFRRRTPFLTQETFRIYRSETDMMRYIKKLERRDISLTHSMIALGSCTMKLNAAAEMLPLSFPELYDIHPFAPYEQTLGYREIIAELSAMLAETTGFHGVTFQPNSGASGEYTGLLVIRRYHEVRGEGRRNVALIPSSAHGTNPASAAMAGMSVVTVECDDNGNISVDDLKAKAERYADTLSCIMITYPSTHGVFESRIREIVDTVHQHGGQVYMDGANMNAQAGLTNPGFIGADVCHLNLHKTFAIPHGGGGPGAGPVCTAAHLTPFLPSHPIVVPEGAPYKGITVAASPYGSAMILPVTYGYLKMLGADGLRRATEVAILNANYVSKKLEPHYRTLYKGETGFVAHECIIDLREFPKLYGVDATDIAKRLMDFGFHAPTLSFPVANTLMVEPTESESKRELDRFVEAMLTIKLECEDIASGKLPKDDNPLKMAPHTIGEVAGEEWSHPYSRTRAAFPLPWVAENKFWTYVGRVDNGYGDRHLKTILD